MDKIALIIYLNKDQKEKIRTLAFKRKISQSAVMRQIIDDYFKSIKKGVR